MPWILEHYPAREEWEKRFATEKEALAELYSHICGTCQKGCAGCGRDDCENCEWRTQPPDPTNAGDLLATPCGCECGLHFED